MKTKKILASVLAIIICFSTVFSVAAVTTEPILTPILQNNARIAEELVTEGAVLLENNNNALPLPKADEGAVALFGVGSARMIRIGGGSGDPWTGGVDAGGDAHLASKYGLWHINMYDAFKEAGYDIPTSEMMEWIGTEFDKTLPEKMAWNAQYFFPEPELTEDYVKEMAEAADYAVFTISRNSAEGSDRQLTPRTIRPPVATEEVPGSFQIGDYYLLDKEENNLALLGKYFENVIVVINAPGPIDTKFFDEIPGLDALVYAGLTGQEGGTAMMKLLNGTDNFSGKLIETWAENYEDYPASATFANNDGRGNDERYVEDIYVGYRYFDTANVTPAYPFGYGLSYTDFDIDVTNVTADANKVVTTVNVTNTGDYAGKEVVEIYVSAPDSDEAEKEYQKLMVYGKTDLLQPGDSQKMTLSFNTPDMAYYNEADSAYVLDPGDYIVRVGNSSRNTHVASVLDITTRVVTEQLADYMEVSWDILEENEEVWTKSGKGWTPYTYDGEDAEIASAPIIAIGPENFVTVNNATVDDDTITTYTTDPNYKGETRGYQQSSMAASDTTLGFEGAMVEYDEKVVYVPEEEVTLLDVYKGEKTLTDLVAQMSDLELALINVTVNRSPNTGYMTFNDPTKFDSVRGNATATTDVLWEKYGIPMMQVNDGPGGLRNTEKVTAYDVANNYEPTEVYNFCTSWPSSATRAQTWNLDLLEEYGIGQGQEMAEDGIAVLLGTSLNIHRDPLGGRNFEYYSEDPIVNGYSVSAETKGLQSNPGIMADLKHFAANQQETRRGGGNSVMTLRALREIYLKGFEIAVKSVQAASLMTSYNRINNVPTGDDHYLLENIVRGEWGFEGQIVTDWGGGASTPAKSMHAGNDMISPGGNGQVVAVLRNVNPNPVFKENGEIDEFLSFSQTSYTKTFATIGSTLSPDGENIAEAHLGDEYTAAYSEEPVEGQDDIYYILVNGEPIARSVSYSTYRGPREGAEEGIERTVTNYLTSDYATIEDNGKTIAYKVNYVNLQANICRGDLQKSAIRNLKAIMNSVNAIKAYEGNEDVEIKGWTEMYEDKLVEYYTVTKSPVDTGEAPTEPQVTDYTREVEANGEITITAVSGSDVAGFMLYNENGGAVTIKKLTKVAEDNGSYTWTITTAVGTPGDRELSLVPVSREEGKLTAIPLYIEVTGEGKPSDILSAEFDAPAVIVNEEVGFNVTSEVGVNRINVYNENGGKMGKTLDSKTVNDGVISWNYTMTIGTAGDRTFTAVAPNESSASADIVVLKAAD